MRKVLSMLLIMGIAMVAAVLFVFPIAANAATTYEFLFPVNNGGVKIAYKYGYSSAYFDNKVFHYGIDIHSSTDQVIYAAFSGTVIETNDSCSHVNYGENCGHDLGFGNSIYIKSDDGKLCSIYGHLKQYSLLVKEGDYVEQGEPIASMGSSGWSTGKHLHFEVRTNADKQSSAINVNSDYVNYITSGYKQYSKATSVNENTYTFSNDGYRMFMKKDESNYGTLGVSNSTVTSKFEFRVIKDGNYYRIVPVDGGENYLNSVWPASASNHTLDGAEVTLCKNDKNDYSQKWIFEKCGNGYLIHPACTPAFSITRDGDKLIVKETTMAANQIWILEGDCDHFYTYNFNNSEHWQECSYCKDKEISSPHSYTNGCDPFCNVCNATRAVPDHSFGAYSYDSEKHWQYCTSCNVINSVQHIYTDNHDISCNFCGYTREATHSWGEYESVSKSGHRRTCSVCGEIDPISAHIYDTYQRDLYGHRKACSVCGEATGDSEEHFIPFFYKINDSYHRGVCTICNETLDYEHTYANEYGTSCGYCDYERTIEQPFDNQHNDDEPTNNKIKYLVIGGVAVVFTFLCIVVVIVFLSITIVVVIIKKRKK